MRSGIHRAAVGLDLGNANCDCDVVHRGVDVRAEQFGGYFARIAGVPGTIRLPAHFLISPAMPSVLVLDLGPGAPVGAGFAHLGELFPTRTGAVPPRPSREAKDPATVKTSCTSGVR